MSNSSFDNNPTYILLATLVEPTRLHDVSDSAGLNGSHCSCLFRLKDVNSHYGGFFVFPDLMISVEGQYRLCFTLYELLKQVEKSIFLIQ